MFDISPLRLYGSSSIGVFMAANNLLTFLPNDVPEKVEDIVRNT
ncbi:MAG: translation initiation factor 6, partial [Pyrobaculum sp.]